LRDRPKHVSTIVENFTSAEDVGGNRSNDPRR
jgi:hypothetical protein